jgi:hypothetical protein
LYILFSRANNMSEYDSAFWYQHPCGDLWRDFITTAEGL